MTLTHRGFYLLFDLLYGFSFCFTYSIMVCCFIFRFEYHSKKEKGLDERDIYMDKQSGKDFNRVQPKFSKFCTNTLNLIFQILISLLNQNHLL
jgi:hypothetical protein